MLTLTCCQDHILLENIWFVCSETSYSGDERRCYRCGTTDRTTEDRATQPMEWKLEAESRNFNKCASTLSNKCHYILHHALAGQSRVLIQKEADKKSCIIANQRWRAVRQQCASCLPVTVVGGVAWGVEVVQK